MRIQLKNILIGLVKQIVSSTTKKKEDSFSIFFFLGPMEYLRGKRLWLFPKKDEHVNNHEKIPNAGPTAGIWRSGIVGRRRR